MLNRRIVILISDQEFYAVTPKMTEAQVMRFENNTSGLHSFVIWALPQLGLWRWLRYAWIPEICVIESKENANSLSPIAYAISRSAPPVNRLEPFHSSYTPLNALEKKKRGIENRTIQDAIEYAKRGAKAFLVL